MITRSTYNKAVELCIDGLTKEEIERYLDLRR